MRSGGLACDNAAMNLRLVPKSEPAPKDELALRVKAMRKPDGALQCNRCGGLTSLTVHNGSRIKNGRVQPGTVIYRHICELCYVRDGVVSFMLPNDNMPRLVRPRKPRRTKPKLVK